MNDDAVQRELEHEEAQVFFFFLYTFLLFKGGGSIFISSVLLLYKEEIYYSIRAGFNFSIKLYSFLKEIILCLLRVNRWY